MRRVLDPYTDPPFLNCYAGDFNDDSKSNLLIHNDNSILLYRSNGSNWSIAYLGLLQSNGSGLSMATPYDGTVPGWQMRTNDTHSVADINADGKADLFVYNYQDWSTQYLGRMISEGTTSPQTGSRIGSVSGTWGPWISLRPVTREGASGKPDLFVHTHDRFGMISAGFSIGLQKIYSRWIHKYRYGRNW